MPLKPGLYEAPITQRLADELATLAEGQIRRARLDPAEIPHLIAQSLHHRLVHALASFAGNSQEKLDHQLQLANRLIELLERDAPRSGAELRDRITPFAEKLLAILPADGPTLARVLEPVRPGVALTASELIVNGHRDLSLGPELNKEFASANRVQLLCSFLKYSGVRLIRDAVAEFIGRNPGQFQILTTTYMGATERRALDVLQELGADIRISFDIRRTRLHAKAWLFHRESGFSTAYIGSSNLSHAAMLDGAEWNVRVSRFDNLPILQKFEAVFEQYWHDSGFDAYDPDTFDRALRTQSQANEGTDLFIAIELHPRPHQARILACIEAEREHGHHRNLVVAATGTGKTIIAAIDYARLCRLHGSFSLLFVAHREQILRQSMAAFRIAMRDGAFGELLVNGQTPEAGRHVFASIQSLHEGRLETLDTRAFDVVIVDEFHHACAPTYTRLLDHLEPRFLLGLTATPERHDGGNILHWFGGRIAAELRLWEALDQGLLCPFQYFGVSDGTDLSNVGWTGSRYNAGELSNLYTADNFRALRILQEVQQKILDPMKMSALGFCVTVAHAEFMAAQFNRAGLHALAVTTQTPHGERENALADLRNGSVRILFTVDLFNEGIDLPDVDTVLFLRPTESATVFLQQLGRGLRLSDRKECLTVLDFVGRAHRRFRFDARFKAIAGGTRRELIDAIENDFPRLPSGCAIRLDRQAKETVLANIRESLARGQAALIEDLQALPASIQLSDFMQQTGLDLDDIYINPEWNWTRLKHAAGRATALEYNGQNSVLRAVARLTYLNDTPRIQAWRQLLLTELPPPADDSDPWQRMLFVSIGHFNRSYAEMYAAWRELWHQANARSELLEILDAVEDRVRRPTYALRDSPLHIHADYSLDEIAAAFDLRTRNGALGRPQGTGVKHIPESNTDLFFVTLEKIESEYTPSTLYNDFPISSTLFHWESQSSTHETTPTGQRYINQQSTGGRSLLFVRRRRRDPRGFTCPYTLLGPVRYVRHEGGRPMKIIWELERPMPPDFYEETKLAAG